MRSAIVLILTFISFCSHISGQEDKETLSGEVSYLTSKNIYIKFEDTEKINVGDTLYSSMGKIPCLVVDNKSSRSCVCSPIGRCDLAKGDAVVFVPALTISNDENAGAVVFAQSGDEFSGLETDSTSEKNQQVGQERKEEIRGRISVSNYSTISDIRDNRNRLASRFTLYANNIQNSKFSFSSYFSYRQNFIQNDTNSTRKTLFFNVYDLALKYDFNASFSLLIGRKINPKMSMVGAIDGLQGDFRFGKFYVGAIVGSRPDIADYSFNPNLFQYGAYIGIISKAVNFFSQTTLGYMEQRNEGEIDRRYLYFQHSSTVIKKLNLFASFEIDLYKKVNDVPSNEFNLTNLYASARYRFSRKFDMMFSYNNRKRILYYETFQTEIERLLNDDIPRQGIRAGAHYRPVNYLNIGFNYSIRFQNNSENKSDNYNGNVSYSKLPGIGGRLSFNYNYNISNYLKSNAFSVLYSKMFLRNKLSADFYYRYLKYDYFNREPGLSNPTPVQNYFGAGLSVYFKHRFTFSISGEYSKINPENNYRIYVKLAKRFRNKKK